MMPGPRQIRADDIRDLLDANLRAIASLQTTTFGRSLLTLASLGVAKITLRDGSEVTLSAALSAIDTAAPDFQTSFGKLFTTWFASLPTYSGTGPAPVPAGKPFNNNGTLQIAK